MAGPSERREIVSLNHVLQGKASGHCGCNQRVSWSSSLSLGWYTMSNRTVLIAFVLLTSACSNAEHYANADAFRAAVSSWEVVGRSLDEAKAKFLRHEFTCDGARCSRDLDGFPCNQRLRVDLSVGASHLVEGFEIWTINGKLPSQCP